MRIPAISALEGRKWRLDMMEESGKEWDRGATRDRMCSGLVSGRGSTGPDRRLRQAEQQSW